jgi:hypothetical protein
MPNYLESFRGRVNQSTTTDWNVETVVDSVFHVVDERARQGWFCRDSNLLLAFNIAMWGRG